MSDTNKMNPLVATAAVAVIIFSAVGVGVMTGVIPSSKSANDALTKPAPTETVAVPQTHAVPAPQPAARKTAPAAEHLAVNDRARAARCLDCGVVDSVNVIDKKGSGTGLGVAGGAVVGGIVGNQIGNGRGNTAATVVGAVGGALAGNEVEKRVRAVKEYQVVVRMDDGNTRTFAFESAPGYTVGDKVKILDGRLIHS